MSELESQHEHSGRPRLPGAGARPGAPWLLLPWGILVILLVSVLVHVGLAAAVWARPIGYVSLADLLTVRQPVRVKRAPSADMVRGPAAQAGTQRAIDVSAVSEVLLQEKSALPQEPPAIEVAMRESPPGADAGEPEELKVSPRTFETAEQTLALMAGKPEELSLAPGSSAESGSGNGTTSGGASGGGGEAGRLLREAGLPGGSLPGAPALDMGEQLPGALPGEPQAVTHAAAPSLTPGGIDFTAIALKSTEQLDIPEHLDEDFDYLVTKFTPARGQGYFKVEIVPRRSLRRLETMPKDVVFVIDTSASIPQAWVTQMTLGVKFALGSLNPQDRFNIMMFSEQPRLFREQITSATPANLDAAVRFLDNVESAGATDMNAAVSRLLTRDLSTQRVYNLVLISDGKPTRGVMDTRDLINIITRDNDLNASIYCVGVTEEPNRELLDFLAYRNKGFSVFADDRRRVATDIRELMSRLRFPLIKDVSFNVAGLDSDEVYPANLPDVHQAEHFAIYGRFGSPATFTFQISGHTAGGKAVDFTFTRSLAQAPEASRADGVAMARDWAFWKLHHLYSEIIRQGDTPALRRAIEQLKEQYGLKTLY